MSWLGVLRGRLGCGRGAKPDTLSGNHPEAAEAALWRDAVAERLARGERVVLRAEGQSMWPTLRAGRHVVIGPLPAGGVRRGDVVLTTLGSRPVLHRVVGLRQGAALMKGDANPRADGWVPLGRLVGAVSRGQRGACVALASRLGGRLGARLVSWLRRHLEGNA